MVGMRTLLRKPAPIHIVLCRVGERQRSPASGAIEGKGAEGVATAAQSNELDVELVATCELDWRRALGR